MTLLTQLREEAARLADEAAPEVLSAIEHLGTPGATTKLLVALIGRVEESLPSIIRPIDAPLAAALTTSTPSDAELAEAAAIQPNPPLQAAPVSPPVQVEAPQQPTVEQLAAELAQERAKVAALQSAATPAPEPAPNVEVQS